MKPMFTVIAALVVAGAIPSPAAAGEGEPGRSVATPATMPGPTSEEKAGPKIGLFTGLKGSLGFLHPFVELGIAPGGELEVGFLLPFLEHRLGLHLSGSYAVARASGMGEDPRLPGGSYFWEITQKELMFALGASVRILPPLKKIANGYLSVGPRLFLLETVGTGGAGTEEFGENRETGTRLGFFAALGGEVYLGPGAAFIEAQLSWTRFNGRLTGEASGALLGGALGYRLIL